MKHSKWVILTLAICLVIAIVAIAWLVSQKRVEENYQGMSIIPEQHADIPLYEGLKLSNGRYVMKGNHWRTIHEFYTHELPRYEWVVEYMTEHVDSAEGFNSRWLKDGFDGELWIWSYYDQVENLTKVVFDKQPIYHSTNWIADVPSTICIYEVVSDQTCNEVNDKDNIEVLIALINDAIDWKDERLLRSKTSVIDFGTVKVKVYYEDDKEIYFVSDYGIKLMKPEREFFQITNLPR